MPDGCLAGQVLAKSAAGGAKSLQDVNMRTVPVG